jgi:ectoine hydroxylase-related dioxygenase (phytanoyl-CoA dioxygenase family)
VATVANESFTEGRAKYDSEGYGIFRNVIDQELVDEISQHVDWLRNHHPGVPSERLGRELMKNDPFWVRAAKEDRLLDVAQLFIGPDIALLASRYVCKVAFDGKAVPWHQDGTYWPVEPMEVVSLWVAIDSSTVENGCMRVIPRSHLKGILPLQSRSTAKSKVIEEGPDVLTDPELINESQAVNLELRPGDVLVHHPLTVHGSNINSSPHRRCGLVLRYMSTRTQITSEMGNFRSHLFLMRGNVVPGINDYRPYPRYVAGQHMPFRGCENWR